MSKKVPEGEEKPVIKPKPLQGWGGGVEGGKDSLGRK